VLNLTKFFEWVYNACKSAKAMTEDLETVDEIFPEADDADFNAAFEESDESLLPAGAKTVSQQVVPTPAAISPAPLSGFRTDRHNNPTAFTTDIAKLAGLTLGVDYEQGDSFGGGKYFTARLLGDAVQTTIRVIDRIGFTTSSGSPRWTYTDSIPNFDAYEGTRLVVVIRNPTGGTITFLSTIVITPL
jgi:hypothetical protein